MIEVRSPFWLPSSPTPVAFNHWQIMVEQTPQPPSSLRHILYSLLEAPCGNEPYTHNSSLLMNIRYPVLASFPSVSLHSTTLLPWIAVQINCYTQLFVSESASGETNPGKRSRWQHLNLLANLCITTSETIRYYILPDSMQQGVCMKYAFQKK